MTGINAGEALLRGASPDTTTNARATCASTLEFELQELQARAEAMGVELQLEVDPDTDEVWLARIERMHGAPGNGALILEELREIIDEADATLKGIVDPPTRRLISYYREQEFEVHILQERAVLSYP